MLKYMSWKIKLIDRRIEFIIFKTIEENNQVYKRGEGNLFSLADN